MSLLIRRDATLTLALLDEDGLFLESETGIPEFNEHGKQPRFYLTGQVVAPNRRAIGLHHRILPLAREAKTPPKQRTAKKVNANFVHLMKSG